MSPQHDKHRNTMKQRIHWTKVDNLETLRILLLTPSHTPPPSLTEVEPLHLEITSLFLRTMGSTFFQYLKEQYPNIRWRWHVGNDPALAMRAIQLQVHDIIFSGAPEYTRKLTNLAQQNKVTRITTPSTQQEYT